jgi:sec-independent protein translocase protein TatA
MNLGAPELLIVLLIVLVVFGGAKLPKLARSLGEAQKEFKKGQEDGLNKPEGQSSQGQSSQGQSKDSDKPADQA